ncbi:MAG TPA: hypothetical protein VMD79_06685 [Solirubrobacteraceae bacterium]|nr:hypothetical protein [Solirubrobacteraceae bacterium]
MPYIYCPRCGAGRYTNVRSCPTCRMPLRPEHNRRLSHRIRRVTAATRLGEEVEEEVRDALYGWHSGCVERCE